MESDDWKGEAEMTTTLEATSALAAILNWVRTKDKGAISVGELYDDGPAYLGMTEIDLRRCVNEGIRQRALTIGGLANTIELTAEAADGS